ncbi:hypothetical protein [Nocardioides ultimimeridianus]
MSESTMPEQTPGSTRIIQGHQVTDRHGCRFGVLDFNPDTTDPALALLVRGPDGAVVGRPVCRAGVELACGQGRWHVAQVRTEDKVYVDLLPVEEDR